jgi:hypothetical protein
METLLWDIRYALRGLRRAPTFTAVAVLTLGLGIGANTAIFTIVDAVLLEPLPYRHPESLVTALVGFSSRAEFVRLRERTRALSEVAAYNPQLDLALSGDGDPVRVIGSSVSADLFTTLGVGAQLGRTFLPDDNHTGHDNVVVLSHDLWLQRYGGDPQILGRTLPRGMPSRICAPRSPARRRAKGSRKIASGRSDSTARYMATQRAVSETLRTSMRRSLADAGRLAQRQTYDDPRRTTRSARKTSVETFVEITPRRNVRVVPQCAAHASGPAALSPVVSLTCAITRCPSRNRMSGPGAVPL